MKHNTLSSLIEQAKRYVIARGENTFAFICRGPDGLEMVSDGEYRETWSENSCVAAVWSYRDGRYDSSNQFHENGRLAAAIETY
jgi:hypothetical protein